jgi:hypothetical protein
MRSGQLRRRFPRGHIETPSKQGAFAQCALGLALVEGQIHPLLLLRVVTSLAGALTLKEITQILTPAALLWQLFRTLIEGAQESLVRDLGRKAVKKVLFFCAGLVLDFHRRRGEVYR